MTKSQRLTTPLVRRLTADQAGSGVQDMQIQSLGWVAAGIFLIFMGLLDLGLIPTLLLIIGPALIVPPLLTTYYAALVTARDTADPAFELLQLLPYESRILGNSYFWASLHRGRLLRLTTGLSLPVVFLVLESWVTDGNYYRAASLGEPLLLNARRVSRDELAAMFGLMLGGIWFFNWLGPAIGVLSGLAVRNPVTAPAVALLTTTLLLLGGLFSAMVIPASAPIQTALGAWLVFALAPVVLTGLSLVVAAGRVRAQT